MKAMTPRLLGSEFLTDVAAAWVAALVFAGMAGGADQVVGWALGGLAMAKLVRST